MTHNASGLAPSDLKRLRARTAYHEAGHAVAMVHLGISFSEVSIREEWGSHGRVEMPDYEVRVKDVFRRQGPLSLSQRRWVEGQVFSAYSGPAAEERFRADSTDGWENHDLGDGLDRRGARDLLLLLEDPHLPLTDEHSERLLERYYTYKAEQFVRTPHNWRKIEMVAEALLSRRVLTRAQVKLQMEAV